eukprot:5197697-Pyramimonas_sp.AAC.1
MRGHRRTQLAARTAPTLHRACRPGADGVVQAGGYVRGGPAESGGGAEAFVRGEERPPGTPQEHAGLPGLMIQMTIIGHSHLCRALDSGGRVERTSRGS